MEIFILLATAAGLTVVAATVGLIYTMEHPERRTLAYALAKRMPTDPSQLGVAYSETTVTLPDAATTPVWILEGAQPEGPLVVITHGWSASRYNALMRAVLYLQYASKLVIYDMRGHGESTAQTCTLGRLEPGDLLSILDQTNLQQRPVVLVGISMGAGITIAAAADREARKHNITGVMIEGPYRYPMEPVVGHLRCRRWPPYPMVWLADAYYRLRIPGYERYDRALHAAQLRCPLVILHGSDDPICPIDSAKAIADAAPLGRFVPIEGAGHSDLFERDEPLYRQAIRDLFTSAAEGSRISVDRNHRPMASPASSQPSSHFQE